MRALSDDEVWIEHVSRRLGDEVAVSVFLVNRRQKPDQGRPPAEDWIFQPELKVTGADDDGPFLPREHQRIASATDPDLESNALLYRNRREFAVGHGTAVTWDATSDVTARSIATCTLPKYELPRVEPTRIAGAEFEMRSLAEATDGDELERRLQPLVAAYREWIELRSKEIDTLPDELRATARDHARYWIEAAERIERAIELLRDNEAARKAFCFANHAMLLQRSHSDWASHRQDDPASAPAVPVITGSWRPFQLAFILLALRGIVEPTHDDRRRGDLLWFPTGGGKTEA